MINRKVPFLKKIRTCHKGHVGIGQTARPNLDDFFLKRLKKGSSFYYLSRKLM